MPNAFFKDGTATVGKKEVPFEQILVQKEFKMFLPKAFTEDANMAYRYAFYSNKRKSPLSIAIRFTSVLDNKAKEKMILNYFSGDKTCEILEGVNNIRVIYRESVISGTTLNVYTMRFAIEIEDGVLFGCFNSSSEYKEDWREVVLAMLQSIERVAL